MGTCTYGVKCTFAHGDADLATNAPPPPPGGGPGGGGYGVPRPGGGPGGE